VAEHGEEELFDILRNDVVAPAEERPGADRLLEREAASDRGADGDDLELAGRANEVDDPALEQVVDVDVLDRPLERLDLLEGDDRLQVLQGMAGALLADDVDLVVAARVAECRLEKEAVELRLGQWKGALYLDRVLGGEDEEGLRHEARHAVAGHLPLGHRLEERRLSLRHRPVDLVDEDDVREDRPGAELEVAGLLVVDREPGDVGRLEIRRALDPGRGRALDRHCDRASEDGLGGAGNVFEKYVPLGRERGENQLDLAPFAVHDALDVVQEALRNREGGLETLVLTVRGLGSVHVWQSRRRLAGRGSYAHLFH
jgi:hypothetical protein